MRRSSSSAAAAADEGLNPYIALSDVLVGVALIFVLCVALGRLGRADDRYRRAQARFRSAVENARQSGEFPIRPELISFKNDPPGAQRWAFAGSALFQVQGSAGAGHPILTPSGARSLRVFAGLLRAHQARWQRIRVEGHTRPPMDQMTDDWELSSARAAEVARRLVEFGKIRPYYFAVAGRAGQNPAFKVMLFYETGDSLVAGLRRQLSAAQIAHSARDVKEDPAALQDLAGWMGRAPGRREVLGQAPSPSLPVFVTLEGDWQERVETASKPEVLQRIRDRYPRNDRVEVIVEYTNKQDGGN